MPNRVTEKTSIPLYLAFAVFGGGAVWATKISISIDAHAAMIQDVRKTALDNFDDVSKRLDSIEQRLSGIEGELRRIKK